MSELTREEQEAVAIGDYKYGFHDEVTSVFATRRGRDEGGVVRGDRRVRVEYTQRGRQIRDRIVGSQDERVGTAQ